MNQLCDAGDAVDAALELAARISACAPLAVRAARQALIDSALADDETAWRISFEASTTAAASPDCAEGVRAFVEKRAPIWSDV